MEEFRMRFFICFVLVSAHILNAGCIHVSPNEVKTFELSSPSALSSADNTGVEIKYLVYKTSRLPLSLFFRRLKRGDYREAFQRMDFQYRGSNVKSEVLEDMLDAGFIPVYVKLENKGPVAMRFDVADFSLSENSTVLAALSEEQLPHEFEHFSPQALVANVYNTGVVIVGFAAIMGVMVLSADKGNADLSGFGVPGTPEIYNSVQRTTKLEYQKYLLKSSSLKTGESAQGLLFFRDPTPVPEQNYRLLFSTPNAVPVSL